MTILKHNLCFISANRKGALSLGRARTAAARTAAAAAAATTAAVDNVDR